MKSSCQTLLSDNYNLTNDIFLSDNYNLTNDIFFQTLLARDKKK